MLKITLIDVLVQGEMASHQIANAIRHADTLNVDAIVVSRGGGSIEDLWAFNEENVATALFHAQTFTVSAVGHEIDWVISDYVADLRAATPTAAMELLLFDQWEMHQYMDGMRGQLNQRMYQLLSHSQKQLDELKQRFSNYSIDSKFASYTQEISMLKGRMNQFFIQRLQSQDKNISELIIQMNRTMHIVIQRKEQSAAMLQQGFTQANPANKDTKGIVELSSDGKKMDIEDLEVGQKAQIANSKVALEVEVSKKVNLG